MAQVSGYGRAEVRYKQSAKLRIVGFPPIGEREVDAIARKFLQSTLSCRVLHVDTRYWAAAGRDGPVDVIVVGQNVIEECQRLDGSAFEVDRDLVLFVEIVNSGGPTARSAVYHISEHISYSADSESSGVRSMQHYSPEFLPNKSSYSFPATLASEDSSDRLTTRSAPPIQSRFRFLSSLFGGTSSSGSRRDVEERSSEADPILAPKSHGQGGLADSLTAGPHDGPLAWSTGSEINEQDNSMLFGAQRHGLISSRSRGVSGGIKAGEGASASSPPPSTAVPSRSGSDSSSAAAKTRSVHWGESTSGSKPTTSDGDLHRRPEAEWPARPPMLRALRSAQYSQSMAALPSDEAKKYARIHDTGVRRFSDAEHVYRGFPDGSPRLQKPQPFGDKAQTQDSTLTTYQVTTTGPRFARTASSVRPPSHLSRRPAARLPDPSPEGPAAVARTAASAPGGTQATAATLSASALQAATQAKGMVHARVAASTPMQRQGAGQAYGAPMHWMPQEYLAHASQPEGLPHPGPQAQPRQRYRGISGQHRLYVSGVPTVIEDETIEMHFSQFGEVQDVYRPVYYRSETGHLQTKGGSYRTQFRRDFCFVTMRTAEEVERCIRTSPRIIAGMPIKDIKAAKDRGDSAAAVGHAARRTGSGSRFAAGRHAPAAVAAQQQYHGGGMAPQLRAAQVGPFPQGGVHPYAGPGGQLQGFPAPFIGGNTQVMMSSPMSILGSVPPPNYAAVPAPMGVAAMSHAPGFMPAPGGNMHAASGVGPALAPTGTFTHPSNIQAVAPAAVPAAAGGQPAAPTSGEAAKAAPGKEVAKPKGNS